MSAPKRIHLERSEAFFIFALIVMTHGLLFLVGFFTGFKMQKDPPHPTAEVAKHDAHGASASHDEHGERAPAAVSGAEKIAPDAEDEEAGALLKKAYRQSKQQAFLDLVLDKEVRVKPNSVASAEAHFNATAEWDRKPASLPAVDDLPPPPSEAPSPEAEPSAVKKLFERKPSALDVFRPLPGNYTVQVGSYASTEEAQAKVREMRNRGFNEAYVVPVKRAGGDWHRVQFGSFPSPDWAKKSGEKLVRYQLAHGFIVQKVK